MTDTRIPATYTITTLGCKVNQYDSERVRMVLEQAGLTQARPNERADLCVVNTCTVTHSATRKSRQAIYQLVRQHPDTQVVVAGCWATDDRDAIAALPGVALVLGHNDPVLHDLREFVTTRSEACRRCSATTPGDRRIDDQPDAVGPTPCDQPKSVLKPSQAVIVKDKNSASPCSSGNFTSDDTDVAYAEPGGSLQRFADRSRAFVKIQDGCDARCTFCIVTRLRGPVRWRQAEDVVAEIRTLVANGYREIVLTGVFLGAYGYATAVRRRQNRRVGHDPLARLITRIAQVAQPDRLRLSSIEPGDLTDELLDVLAEQSMCVPHLHLVLQSGSDAVLRRMNRQYTHDEFVDAVDRARRRLDRPAITTDVIVGFPGETEDDFTATLDMIDHADMAKVHAFPFSPRNGTPAARLPGRLDDGIVRERMQRLAEKEAQVARDWRRQFLGQTVQVLLEQPVAPNQWLGHSERYFSVRVHFGTAVTPSADVVRRGDVVAVRLDDVHDVTAMGTQVATDHDTDHQTQ